MEDLKRQTYMLLLNMLPEHVAQHFLERPPDSDELYSKKYNCTSVIFASIPEFSNFFLETEQIDGQVCVFVQWSTTYTCHRSKVVTLSWSILTKKISDII